MRFSIFSICLYVFALLHIPAAQADSRFSYCKKGESTADVMACAKKRYEDAQDALDRIFEQGLSGLDFADTQLYRAAQKGWVAYRDRECAWQARQADSESLKRIEELSCLKTVTERRTAALQAALNEQKDKNTAITPVAPESEGTPLWMNVLAGENPDIYWRYGDRIEADMNCDGITEHIMAGLKTPSGTMGTGQDQQITALIGISESPPIGRPRTYVIEPPAAHASQTEKESLPSCGTTLLLKILERPAPDIDEIQGAETQETTQPFCAAALLVERARCPLATIYWNGNSFEVEKTPDQ
ncbi:MAG: lysozyme inhibitor LprI family protein [Alphaproteobacteria bacterium]